MSQEETLRSMPDLPGLVEEWQTGGLDEASQKKLSHLLLFSRDARQYFLELCQIDAELRWRFASQAQIAGTLAHQEEGMARPIAAIVLSGLGLRDDAGFPAVFNKVEASEPHAQQWLEMYLVLRACIFVCLPTLSDAEATVSTICEELAGHPLTDLSSEQFRQLASQVARRTVGWKFHGQAGTSARNFVSIVQRCLQNSEDIDVVAAYESFETCVPRHVPAESLRLLCMRYLLELSPTETATKLNLPEQAVCSKLAEVRLQVWKACISQVNLCEVPAELTGFSRLNRAIDRPEMFEPAAPAANPRLSSERLLQELDEWIGRSDANCRCFVTFAVLHESLYRRLSLNHLLEESKTRRDEQFHRIVTDMVLHLEDSAESARPTADTLPPAAPSRVSAAWLAAIAAAFLIAATASIWWSSRPAANMPSDPLLAHEDPSLSEPVITEPPPAEPPPRTIVAVVKTTLEAEGPDGQKFEAGSAIYADERIELAAGIVHLSTPSGSEWVLEGPIAVVMKQKGELSLLRGKLAGLNGGQAQPLLVRTPSAHVLDTGTEFGVSVGDDLRTSVAVYDGSVELSTAAGGSSRDTISTLNIEADFEASVQQDGALPRRPTRLIHDRVFIRPDEVELRQQRQQGSVDAAEKVAFFELLRIEGLLAYQGFHSASNGKDFTIGFLPPRARQPLEFGNDLASDRNGRPTSGSVVLSNDSTIFLDLDVSDRSPLARAGLLDASNFVAARDTEVWLCWRSKVSLPAGGNFHWTGLSLMHGDERTTHEPVFIGKPAGSANLGMQVFTGQEESIHELDAEPHNPETQPLASDNHPHLWVARVAIQDTGASTVSAWCDVDPTEIGSTPAYTEQHLPDFKFDRLRLEVSPEGDRGQCAYDEVILTTSREALIEAMACRSQQVAP